MTPLENQGPLLLTYVPDQPLDADATGNGAVEGMLTTADSMVAPERVTEEVTHRTADDVKNLLTAGSETEPESLTLRNLFLRIISICPPGNESRARTFLQLLARSVRRCEWDRALRVINENRPQLPEVDAVEGLIHLSMKRDDLAEPFLEKAVREGSEPLRRCAQAMLVRIHKEKDYSAKPVTMKPREYRRPGRGGTPSNSTRDKTRGFRMFAPGAGNEEIHLMREVGEIVAAIEAVEAAHGEEAASATQEGAPRPDIDTSQETAV